jgi:class 3 adenylate cyclase
LVGFARMTEELEPEVLTDILNSYLDEMVQIALKYGATIDKFIGDAIMLFFWWPQNTRS